MMFSLGAECLEVLLELKILDLETIDFGGYILESIDFFSQKCMSVLVSCLEFWRRQLLATSLCRQGKSDKPLTKLPRTVSHADLTARRMEGSALSSQNSMVTAKVGK